jgi:K+/H+ antiporter YhaU regulatory subunit KhtT
MIQEKSGTFRIEEISVVGTSPWQGKSISHLNLRSEFQLTLLAIKATDGNAAATLIVSPPDTTVLKQGSVLIVMGDHSGLERARKAARDVM